MKDFLEKWNNDTKFKAKVQLCLYSSFVIIVAIFAISARDNTTYTNTIELNDEIDHVEQNKEMIKVPEEYSYKINITINGNKYYYQGTKQKEKETITKISNDTTSNYIYQKNNYYKEEQGNYILTTKNEIYDIVGYNYLQIDTINQYLTKSKKEDEKYIVDLKNIILGDDSDEHITLTINNNIINVDYTSLMKMFDNTIESHLIEIIIEEIK